jgi:hypothetical protein
MNLGMLKDLVSQAIFETQGGRSRPSWIAQRALLLADPENVAPPCVAFAADLEFRQIAREMLRRSYEPEGPEDGEPVQHALFPGLQAKYPRHVPAGEEPEYVRPELLDADDVQWNISRMRACSESLQRGADALEAWADERGLLAA